MFNEGLRVNGWVDIILKDRDQRVKMIVSKDDRKDHHVITDDDYSDHGMNDKDMDDVVTNTGLAAILRLIFHGFVEDRFRYIAIGTGTTAESPAQTALMNEVIRKTANIVQINMDVTDDTVMLENVFTSADGLSGSHEITETGIFNASIGGIMLARKVFPHIPVNWDEGDNLYIRCFIQMRR